MPRFSPSSPRVTHVRVTLCSAHGSFCPTLLTEGTGYRPDKTDASRIKTSASRLRPVKRPVQLDADRSRSERKSREVFASPLSNLPLWFTYRNGIDFRTLANNSCPRGTSSAEDSGPRSFRRMIQSWPASSRLQINFLCCTSDYFANKYFSSSHATAVAAPVPPPTAPVAAARRYIPKKVLRSNPPSWFLRIAGRRIRE